MPRCKNQGCVADLSEDQIPPERETPANSFSWSSLFGGGARKKRSAEHPCVSITVSLFLVIINFF